MYTLRIFERRNRHERIIARQPGMKEGEARALAYRYELMGYRCEVERELEPDVAAHVERRQHLFDPIPDNPAEAE